MEMTDSIVRKIHQRNDDIQPQIANDEELQSALPADVEIPLFENVKDEPIMEVENPPQNVTEDDSKCPISENTVTTTTVKPNELQSIENDFGFEKFDEATIPYILRDNKKFFAVRMVKKTLKKLYSIDPTKYGHIYSYSITKSERNLLDRVNNDHCNNFFGRRKFHREERLLEFEDVQDIGDFVGVCSRKLKNTSLLTDVLFGLVKINGEHEIPYMMKDGIKYVPLAFLKPWKEIEDKLKEKLLHVEMFEGWDLSYLKFCSMIQGQLTDDMFAERAWHVADFKDVVKTLPPNTKYEEYWPSDIIENFSGNEDEDISQSFATSAAYFANNDVESELAKYEASSSTMTEKERRKKKRELKALYKKKNKDLIMNRHRKRQRIENKDQESGKRRLGGNIRKYERDEDPGEEEIDEIRMRRLRHFDQIDL